MSLTKEQIQILLVEKLAGTILEKDDHLLRHLLETDEAVRKEWVDLQGQLNKIIDLTWEGNAEESWLKLKSQLPPTRPARKVRAQTWAAAASIVIVMASSFFLWSGSRKGSLVGGQACPPKPGITLFLENGHNITLRGSGLLQAGSCLLREEPHQMTLPLKKSGTQEWGVLAVPAALAYKVLLSDGSQVWLNARSHLRFPFCFQGPRREVYLQGEAYFKISRDTLHPFVVHTSQTDIQVLGTEFNVNAYHEDKVGTALVKGSVLLRDRKGTGLTIRPGVEAVYTGPQGFRTGIFDPSERLSWMRGVYYFHNTSLKELMEVISRWYDVEVSCENSSLLRKTYSGKLEKNKGIRTFLEDFNLSSDGHAIINDGRIIFH